MNSPSDLLRDGLRKAENHLTDARLRMAAEDFRDACFHLQEAARQMLEMYLQYHNDDVSPGGDVVVRLERCIARDASFSEIRRYGECLAPYTVKLMNDAEFRPSLGTARAALNSAEAIREFVMRRLPLEV